MGKPGITCSVGVMQKSSSLGKKRVFCKPLVICYDLPNRRNDGNSNSQNINVKNK